MEQEGVNRESLPQERERTKIEPVISFGAVDILALGDLHIFTPHSELRRDSAVVPFPAQEVHQANRDEVDFQKKKGNTESPLRGDQFRLKYGVRDVQITGNTIELTAMPVTFPTYNKISNDRELETAFEHASVMGNAMILFSKDGKMIVQHRSAKNRSYGDMIGASVAGVVDAQPYSPDETKNNPELRGKIKPMSNGDFREHIERELFEEVKILPSELKDVKVTGFAKDNRKPHYETLWFAKVNLTADKIEKNARERTSGKEMSEQDFDEKFYVIDGSADAIKRLLTQSRNPLPPTHTASFVAALYHQIETQQGTETAQKTIQELQPALKANLDTIDEQVREYYRAHPDKLPEKYKGQLPVGYDPAFLPQDQGLPKVEEELHRLGLITQGGEMTTTPETEKMRPRKIHLFDVDGVLTDLKDKVVKYPEILDELIQRLENGEPVGLNTGRSLDFLEGKVLNQLEEKIQDKRLLHNLFAIGEKGMVWLTYNQEGQRNSSERDTIVSEEESKELIALQQKIADSIKHEGENTSIREEQKLSTWVEVDETKTAMVSIEMITGLDKDKFRDIQKTRLSPLLHTLKEEHPNLAEFRIDDTAIASDIEHPKAGKDLGAKRLLLLLEEAGVDTDFPEYDTYGDGASDYEMFAELKRKGKKSKFFFVGDTIEKGKLEKRLEGKDREGVIFVEGPGNDTSTKALLAKRE